MKFAKIVCLSFLFTISYSHNAFSKSSNIKTINKQQQNTKEQKYISDYKYEVEDEEDSGLLKLYIESSFVSDLYSRFRVDDDSDKALLNTEYIGSKNYSHGLSIGAGFSIYPFRYDQYVSFGARINYTYLFDRRFIKSKDYNARIRDFFLINTLVGWKIGIFEPYFLLGFGTAGHYRSSYVKSIDKGKYNLAISVGLGINFYITRNISIGIEDFIILDYAEVNFSYYDGNKKKSVDSGDIVSNILNVTLRYNFLSH